MATLTLGHRPGALDIVSLDVSSWVLTEIWRLIALMIFCARYVWRS